MNVLVSNCIDILLDARPPAKVFKPGEVTATCPHCGYNLGEDVRGAGNCPECGLDYEEPVLIPINKLTPTGKRSMQGRGKVFQMPGSKKVFHIPKSKLRRTVMRSDSIEKTIDKMVDEKAAMGNPMRKIKAAVVDFLGGVPMKVGISPDPQVIGSWAIRANYEGNLVDLLLPAGKPIEADSFEPVNWSSWPPARAESAINKTIDELLIDGC